MKRILPGFPLTIGFSITYISIMVVLPIAALTLKGLGGEWSTIWSAITSDRVLASYKLSFGVSLIASLINGFFGLITAWALVRYRFPGRKIIEGLIDLPFALPTAVAGIALTALYAPNGWMGALLGKAGIQAVFNPIGVGIALVFIGFPFVVRTVQPVMIALTDEVEEAAATLGANRRQTFTRVIFPALLPALLTGMTLAFGRAVGEYGSIIFISGNLPFKTEITPLLIVSRLEQYDYQGAAAIGLTMLFFSFSILTLSCLLQGWSKKRIGG